MGKPVHATDPARTPSALADGEARTRWAGIDVDAQELRDAAPELMDVLLADRTSKRNILWATDDYQDLGEQFAPHREITRDLIMGDCAYVIRPRVAKTRELRTGRRKGKAEVFTPSWLCNEQNNLIDGAWFGRSDVFNQPVPGSWKASPNRVAFDAPGTRTWTHYVDEPRLEAACGEAPYLVSRYDTTTGAPIELGRRIGLLDRKLRVVGENAQSEEAWLEWSRRAYESTYGFEFQGDSLLLARENLLRSYIDYVQAALQRPPSHDELLRIARIISWNLWQMDALTGTIPFEARTSDGNQLSLFDVRRVPARPCKIRDWRLGQTIDFGS